MLTSPLRPQPAEPATQVRRFLRLTATLIGHAVREQLVSTGPSRRRKRLQVCSAARILTALDVRTEVFAPSVPWPRDRPTRLVLGADVGWLGDLALVTAVPKSTGNWVELAERALTRLPAEPSVPPLDGVPCPVAVRYRDADGPLDRLPATLAEIVAGRGLVVEVHLLPALPIDGRTGGLALASGW